MLSCTSIVGPVEMQGVSPRIYVINLFGRRMISGFQFQAHPNSTVSLQSHYILCIVARVKRNIFEGCSLLQLLLEQPPRVSRGDFLYSRNGASWSHPTPCLTHYIHTTKIQFPSSISTPGDLFTPTSPGLYKPVRRFLSASGRDAPENHTTIRSQATSTTEVEVTISRLLFRPPCKPVCSVAHPRSSPVEC